MFKLAGALTDSQKNTIKRLAKMKGGPSQSDIARQLGVSVKTVRDTLKHEGVSWTQKVRKIKTKTVKNQSSMDERRNNFYFNAASKNGIKSPWGGGNSNIR